MENECCEFFPEDKSIPEQHRLSGPVHQRRYLIDGQLRDWSGPVQTVYSPICSRDTADGKRVLGSYPLLSIDEAMAALAAAERAYNNGQGVWPTMPVQGRIEHLERFVQRMTQNRAEVVKLLMWEIGKTAADSAKEFDRTVKYILDTIQALKELDRSSSRFVIDSEIIGQIRRAPLGVVLCVGPYNYPLNETFTTLIPALLMGNTVVFKPARHGVLLLEPLIEAFAACFPAGVVNTVYGKLRELAGPMMASGKVDCLAFIGSTKVADILKQQHPRPHRLRSVLGLAAKNPAIVLPDADLPSTVKECLLGALSYNGQRCTALKILFVHSSILEPFLAQLSAEVERLVCGMPWTENVFITPLPEEEKPEYLCALIEDALAKGARVVNPQGGRRLATFFYPAIVCPVQPGMRLYEEEQFGPIVAVCPFSELGEPLDYIINSPYGQQMSIFGKEPQQIAAIIDPVVNQVCRVNLNSQCQRGPDSFPFTGRKDSAEGTLSVSDALRVFSIRTLVAAKDNAMNKAIINDITRNHRSKFLSDDFLL